MAARKSEAKRNQAKRNQAKRKPAKRNQAKRSQAKGKRTKPAAKPVARPPAARAFASLAELRAAIDALDDAIVPLLCRRLGVVRQAARFKPSHDGVVVLSRVEEIIARVRDSAAALGGSADTIEAVYRKIIDEFTLEEQRNWRTLNARGS